MENGKHYKSIVWQTILLKDYAQTTLMAINLIIREGIFVHARILRTIIIG